MDIEPRGWPNKKLTGFIGEPTAQFQSGELMEVRQRTINGQRTARTAGSEF